MRTYSENSPQFFIPPAELATRPDTNQKCERTRVVQQWWESEWETTDRKTVGVRQCAGLSTAKKTA